MSGLDFFSGLAQGFGNMKARQQEIDRDKQERQARVKLFEIQLQREQEALKQQQTSSAARQAVADKLSVLNQPGEVARPPLLNAGQPQQKMTLTDLLADPQTAIQFLQSGMLKTEDLLTQENNRANRAMVSNIMGGGNSGAPGTSGTPGSGMVLSGIKIGPKGELMPDFAPPPITSPQTVDTPNGPRIKTFDPRTGKEVADLGAGKPDQVLPTNAAQISGMVQAKNIVDSAKAKIINPDGTVNSGLLLSSTLGLPRSEGRQVRKDLELAVDAIIRAKSGQNVPEKEKADLQDMFIPTAFDRQEQVINKFNRLNQFISGTLDTATLPPETKKLYEGGKSASNNKGKVIDFKDLPHR